ncbi:MAG: T9SS type A sorting domain-containing protein [Flavobacterium micromati]|nr:T9SS type A sorting domain-containing protein [Flavobacterium micromati]
MKKLYIFVFVMCLGGLNSFFGQTTYTSITSGNWNSASTWSPSGVPTTSDSVNIGNHTITVTANAICVSITTLSGTADARLVVNTGISLRLTGNFSVRPSNTTNNDTFISGGGSFEANNVVIGFDIINNSFPTATRLTTLYVNDLTLFKIRGNIVSTTAVNANPVAFNESRLRHRSGTIDLDGILSIPAVNPGPAALGYRTDNDNQENSTIIFRNANPSIPSDVQRAPSFTGGAVEFRSVSGTTYTLPSLLYKNLILNSNRSFVSGGSTLTISIGGVLELKMGVFSSTVNNQMRINDGVTIVRSGGSFLPGSNSRLRLTNAANQYNVTYEQSASIIAINDLPAYFPGSTLNNSIRTVTLNSTNGFTFSIPIIPVRNLVVNANCSISGSGKVLVSDLLDIPNGSTINVTDNLITLVSNSVNTARVATLPNGSSLVGKVTVQRFLPNIGRNWRLLTAPVKGSSSNSVWENWQNNGIFNGSDIGADIWGPDGSLNASDNGSTLTVNTIGNGLSLINNSSYNLRKFDNALGTFSNVANTLSQPLFTAAINQGYLAFLSHPFLGATNLEGVGNSGSVQTTLSASGQLITGDVTYSTIGSNKFYLIGNPYASPLDFKLILDDVSNTGVNKLWIIDPTIGLGSYVNWDKTVGYSNAATSFIDSTILQSGQAFFVRASSATTTLTIREAHKSDAISNTTLNRVSSSKIKSDVALFRALLEKEERNLYRNVDGCVAALYDGGNNSLDVNDGRKISNPGENLAIFTDSFSLSIEHREAIVDNDFLTLRISDAVVGNNYKLKLYTSNFVYSGVAYLEDLYSGVITDLPLNGSIFEYKFKVTNDELSTGKRFKIVFKRQGSLGTTDLVKTNFTVYPNPASNHDTITVLLDDVTSAATFSYKIYGILGQLLYEGNFVSANGAGSIELNGKLGVGLHIIQLRNTINNEQFLKKLIIK